MALRPDDIQRNLTAITFAGLKQLSNRELMAVTNALSFTGVISPTNAARDKLLKLGLVDEDGRPKDVRSLTTAVDAEVSRRDAEGALNNFE